MGDKINLCLFTVTYKRPELTEYVFNYYENIKRELSNICNIHLICVGSDGKSGELLAHKYGFEYIEYPNEPVSQKHNKGALECKKYNPDGVIYFGSDDIISVNIIKHHIECLKNNIDFCGVSDVYFLTKDKLGYWGGYKSDSGRYGEPVGPGKLYSNRLMTLLGWKPWGDIELNRTLDRVVTNNLKKHTYSSKIIKCSDVGGLLIDIKTNVNITDINDFVYDKEYGVDYINNLNIDYHKIKHILITKKN
jgi:hypothetical protein